MQIYFIYFVALASSWLLTWKCYNQLGPSSIAIPTMIYPKPMTAPALQTSHNLVEKQTPQDMGDIDICKQLGYVTISVTGRLGNWISFYARLYSRAKMSNVTVVFPLDNLNRLKELFGGLSMPGYTMDCSQEQAFNCSSQDDQCRKWSDIEADVREGRMNVQLKGWTVRIDKNKTNIYSFIDELREKEFKLNQTPARKVNHFLDKIRQTRTKPLTFVSVHVRRGDMESYLNRTQTRGGHYLSNQYYFNAMAHFKNHFNNTVFVVASDDQAWCHRHLKSPLYDIVFTHDPNNVTEIDAAISFDMALLSQLDHSIIGYGSFGFWTAYLKRSGTTIWSREKPGGHQVTLLNSSTTNWIGMDDPCVTMVDDKKVFSYENNCVK